jgi:N,N'-diacetyllegionaminate synthase
VVGIDESRFLAAREAGRCYVIAEAGSNHNGDLQLAARLIEVAADAGADAVKFQLFRAERLYPKYAGHADYLKDETDIYDIVARMELPEAWLPELRARCDSAGIDFLVTPFDEASADAIDQFVPLFKIASYELTHEPLVRHVASKRKPLIMSTGAADIGEIADALSAAGDAGAEDIVLLQCTAAYPARLEALNVGSLADIRERFGVPVGLSDHSADPVIAPVLAVAFGAAVIEKHFTLDRGLPGPDHAFALEPDGLARLVSAVRDAEAARGSMRKEVHDDELELRSFARRSLFALRDIAVDEVLDGSAVGALRRGNRGEGLPPSALPNVLGRRAARAIAVGSPLSVDDIGER